MIKAVQCRTGTWVIGLVLGCGPGYIRPMSTEFGFSASFFGPFGPGAAVGVANTLQTGDVTVGPIAADS